MKKKILFVNDEMTMGGVARILNTLLFHIDKTKYDIDLLVLHKRGELLSEIPNDINVIEGSNFFKTIDIPLHECKLNNIFNKVKLLFYMKTGLINNKIKKERKKILNKKYDIEFSAKEGFCTIFVANGDSNLKFNWIQVDYLVSNYSKNHMDLMKNSLKQIDVNIASSIKSKESYEEVFNISNVIVLHNLMNDQIIKEEALKYQVDYPKDKINLICVARFHRQKGLDRLIKVYARLTDYYSLTIVGDGELKDELYQLAKDIKVFDKVNWTGTLQNPYPYIKEADLFVLPSLYEGYPTIVIESLICGTHVLALEVAGVKEQLTNKLYGKIINNSEEDLYNELYEIRSNKQLLSDYKKELQNYKYNNQEILSMLYEQFEKGKLT